MLYIFILSITLSLIPTGKNKVTRKLKTVSFYTWLFSSFGITSGSYWAFYESGWGGYWNWDSVENSALLSWFILTSLNFSFYIKGFSKKNHDRVSIILGSLSFISVIAGTALIRSGLLNSVHSYSAGNVKISIIAVFLIILYSFPLYQTTTLLRDIKIKLDKKNCLEISFFMILISSILILATGIYYPILSMSDYTSITPDYYKKSFSIIIFLASVSVCFYLNKTENNLYNIKNIIFNTIISLSICLLLIKSAKETNQTLIFLCFSSVLMLVNSVYFTILNKKNNGNRKKIGLLLLSFSIFISSVVACYGWQKNEAFYLLEKEEALFEEYKLDFVKSEKEAKNLYRGLKAYFLVKKDDVLVGAVAPEKRHYGSYRTSTFEPRGLTHNLLNNIKISIDAPKEEGRYTINVTYTPFYSLFWLGIFMFLLFAYLIFCNLNKEEKNK